MDEIQSSIQHKPLEILLVLFLRFMLSVVIVNFFSALIFGISGYGVDQGSFFANFLEGIALALFSLFFIPEIILYALYPCFPVLIFGYAATLFLFGSCELRCWVWVCVLGGMGFIWGAITIPGPSPWWFYPVINPYTLMCFFSASLSGYFMWWYALNKHEEIVEVGRKKLEENKTEVLP